MKKARKDPTELTALLRLTAYLFAQRAEEIRIERKINENDMVFSYIAGFVSALIAHGYEECDYKKINQEVLAEYGLANK